MYKMENIYIKNPPPPKTNCAQKAKETSSFTNTFRYYEVTLWLKRSLIKQNRLSLQFENADRLSLQQNKLICFIEFFAN